MCGIYGFISTSDKGPSLDRIREMAQVTERRGKHAFGLAWISGDGRLRHYKQPGRVSQNLDALDMLSDARAILGHCRYATNGDPENNLNNHPFPCDGGFVAHNGTIPEYRAIARQFGLAPVTDCDSELLALLIEDAPDGTILERCAQAMRDIGTCDATLIGVWKSGRLVVSRRGKPLSFGKASRGYYFASLREGLPRGSSSIPDGVAMEFRRSSKRPVRVSVADLSSVRQLSLARA